MSVRKNIDRHALHEPIPNALVLLLMAESICAMVCSLLRIRIQKTCTKTMPVAAERKQFAKTAKKFPRMLVDL